jgi:hypothetical protein
MTDLMSADRVRELYEERWPAPHMLLGEFWFGHIAVALQVMRDRSARQPDWQAIRYGGLFVHHVPATRMELQAEAARCGQPGDRGFDADGYTRSKAALDALEEAEKAVNKALKAYRERDPWIIKDRDPADYLHELLIRAWGDAGGDVPRSLNDDDPICIFIAKCLDLAGIRVGQGKTKGQPYTPAGISAALREKRPLNFIRANSSARDA